MQGDAFNASRLATIVVVPLTSNLRWASAPGNVLLAAARTGLPRDSVANVSQIVAIDRARLTERVGHLSAGNLELVLAGIDLVLGREQQGPFRARHTSGWGAKARSGPDRPGEARERRGRREAAGA